MKSLAIPLALLAAAAAVLGVLIWAPWDDAEVRERELAWLGALAEWSQEVEGQLLSAHPAYASSCLGTFENDVGPPPAERLEAAAALAREGCAQVRAMVERRAAAPSGDALDHWLEVVWRIRSNVISTRFAGAETTDAPEFGRAVTAIAGDAPRVHCWPEAEWEELVRDLNVLEAEEYWLLGFADPPTNRIHLDPYVCRRCAASSQGRTRRGSATRRSSLRSP